MNINSVSPAAVVVAFLLFCLMIGFLIASSDDPDKFAHANRSEVRKVKNTTSLLEERVKNLEDKMEKIEKLLTENPAK